MNFVIFNESDGIVTANVPYICTEPYSNDIGAPIMVDVYVDGNVLKVFIDDIGIQFFFHVTDNIFRKVFS